MQLEVPPAAVAAADGALRLGTWRSLWAAPEVDLSPVLRFMRPRQVVELSPVDADRLGVRDGDQVEVGSNGTRVRGAARLRAAVPGGSVFLAEGTHDQPANLLTDPVVEVRRVGGAAERRRPPPRSRPPPARATPRRRRAPGSTSRRRTRRATAARRDASSPRSATTRRGGSSS